MMGSDRYLKNDFSYTNLAVSFLRVIGKRSLMPTSLLKKKILSFSAVEKGETTFLRWGGVGRGSSMELLYTRIAGFKQLTLFFI